MLALDAETRRLRKLWPDALAYEAGHIKAELAAVQDEIDRLKAEAVRRELLQAEGELFRLVLTPPGTTSRLDREKLEQAFGTGFVAAFSRPVSHD